MPVPRLRRWATLIASLASVLSPSVVSPQSARRATIAARIETYLAPLAARGDLSGVVLAAQGDTVLFERAYGLANVEMAAPNRVDTRFRIHSITKQFTAAAVVLLTRQGKLSVDSSIRTYLPELPNGWQRVTVLHLLTHTSGLPQLENLWYETFQARSAATELENLGRFVSKITTDSLATAPGTAFGYNNFGYDLLACIVERLSGERFADYVRRRIFEPVGMKDADFDTRAEAGSGMYVASAVVPRLASGYNGSPDKLQVAFPYMYASAGAGGMYATARDLFNYDRALNSGRLLGPDAARENLDKAFRIRDQVSYGYGWMIRRPKEVYYLEHSGGNNGYNADYARYPLDRAVIIVLTNRGGNDATEIRKGIARIVLGSKYD